jgi:hypothetical protein
MSPHVGLDAVPGCETNSTGGATEVLYKALHSAVSGMMP